MYPTQIEHAFISCVGKVSSVSRHIFVVRRCVKLDTSAFCPQPNRGHNNVLQVTTSITPLLSQQFLLILIHTILPRQGAPLEAHPIPALYFLVDGEISTRFDVFLKYKSVLPKNNNVDMHMSEQIMQTCSEIGLNIHISIFNK